MDQAISRECVEETTELALQEKTKLVKSLSRLDMIGFTVCAFVGLDTLGTVASNGGAGVHLADRPRRRLRAALRAAHGRGRQRVHPGGRAVRVGRRWPSGASRAPSPPSSTGSPTRCGSAARWPSSPPRRGTTTSSDPLRRGRRLPLQVPLHLAVDRRRDRLAQARQVDPERRRAHAHRRARASSRSRRSSTPSSTACTASRSATSSRPARLPRARPAAAVQLRRLRAAERRRRGDGGPAEGRPDVGPAQRRSSACCSTRSRSSRSSRAPAREGHRHRRLPGRGRRRRSASTAARRASCSA